MKLFNVVNACLNLDSLTPSDDQQFNHISQRILHNNKGNTSRGNVLVKNKVLGTVYMLRLGTQCEGDERYAQARFSAKRANGLAKPTNGLASRLAGVGGPVAHDAYDEGPQTGINRSSDYFKCYNSAHGDNIPAFWYFFPTAPLAIVPPPPDSVPSASTNDVPGRQPPSILVCKKHSCQSIRVHRICDRGMCKKRCDIDGGCRVHLPPPPPPSQPLPPFTGPNLELLQALRNNANAVPRAAHCLAQDALQNEHKRRAAVAHIPTVTLSPPQLTPVKRHFVLVHWEHDNEPLTVVDGLRAFGKWKSHVPWDDRWDADGIF
ncbi:hypothetical protein K438DRAFT_1769894 [Mycena galopus ATCC 62051]|nr:hypothetical protein K438DRAFT_1769894 [Mycena galopus ATCC 62051]